MKPQFMEPVKMTPLELMIGCEKDHKTGKVKAKKRESNFA